MQNGDRIVYTDKNVNHTGNGICAYAGFEGVAEGVTEENTFVIRADNGSALHCTLQNSYFYKPVHVEVNGVPKWIYHKNHPKNNIITFMNKMLNKLF